MPEPQEPSREAAREPAQHGPDPRSPQRGSAQGSARGQEHRPEPLDAEIVPEPGPASAPPVPDYDDHGVPSLDYVRDTIERRHATSIGAAELAEGTAAGRAVEEQEADRAAAAAAKLEEIRRSLG